MDLGLAGRRALITGASSGLGAPPQKRSPLSGRVAIAARSADKLATVAEALGEGCVTIVADVSTAGASMPRWPRRDALGGIDIVIANAGGPKAGNFAETTADDYPAALDLNLLSAIRLCEATVPAMRAQRWGRIVAITSVAAREPMPNLILSNTARAGLTAFLKTLAREIAADGVTVNSLQPGLHATDRLTTLYGDAVGDVAAAARHSATLATSAHRRALVPDHAVVVAWRSDRRCCHPRHAAARLGLDPIVRAGTPFDQQTPCVSGSVAVLLKARRPPGAMVARRGPSLSPLGARRASNGRVRPGSVGRAVPTARWQVSPLPGPWSAHSCGMSLTARSRRPFHRSPLGRSAAAGGRRSRRTVAVTPVVASTVSRSTS